MPHAAIEVSNVSKYYGAGEARTMVLREVSLTVSAGSFVSLMGSSGSGKTTLLNLVGGLDVPDQGAVRIDGQELSQLDDAARSAFRLRHLGFVFQFFNLVPNLTVQENIALPLLFLNRAEKEARQSAASMAAEVGLGDKLTRMTHQLSGGEMQRVGLARALVHEPRLILADEPTGNLDSRTGTTILELMKAVSKRHGATILMATHDAKATEYSDSVVEMVDGRITSTGSGMGLSPVNLT